MTANTDNAGLPASGAVASPAMLASAFKFKAVWEGAIRRSIDGEHLRGSQIIEMQEAFLGLIWATETTNMDEALEVLRGAESAADSDASDG